MESGFETKEVFLLMSVGIAVMLLLALAFVLFFYFSQRKFQTEQAKAQEEKLRHQEQLLYSTIETQENERQRIAKDLHDVIGSKLNIINLGLHRLKAADETTAKELFGLLNDTIASTRQISHDLLPPILEKFGLKEAIVELCESCRQTASLHISLETKQTDARPTDKLVELNLFRVLRELISNSIKHGEPENIHILFHQNQQNIKLEYREDGKGFDQHDENHKPGLGMQNIESRLKMIGADYDLKSSKGKGMEMNILYNYPNDLK
ncbi:MAG: sensor histidine kinase [Bacteroidetes bacterium]|nr:sensor histidine kinase [Bacteroidota bacterium]